MARPGQMWMSEACLCLFHAGLRARADAHDNGLSPESQRIDDDFINLLIIGLKYVKWQNQVFYVITIIIIFSNILPTDMGDHVSQHPDNSKSMY